MSLSAKKAQASRLPQCPCKDFLVANSRNAHESTAGIGGMSLKNWWAVLESNQRPMD